jgi:prolyl-tRNA editing enzyme YbaK/EbsC (Cys-tRNA(Pro) deacylase)
VSAPELPGSARRVQDALDRYGLRGRVQELPQSTRTAVEAARAVGCEVSQIVKSLIFRGRDSGRPVLAVVSGANRVSEQRLGEVAGEPVARADARYVREHTGFAIGGVAPLAHPAPISTFIDRDLVGLDRLWAAAGTPKALFHLSPDELATVSTGTVADIKE